MRSLRSISCFFSSSWLCLIWGQSTGHSVEQQSGVKPYGTLYQQLTLNSSTARLSMCCRSLSAVFSPSWKKLRRRLECLAVSFITNTTTVCGWRPRLLLALSVVILDEVLQEVHALFGVYLINFDQILRRGDTQLSIKPVTFQLEISVNKQVRVNGGSCFFEVLFSHER